MRNALFLGILEDLFDCFLNTWLFTSEAFWFGKK